MLKDLIVIINCAYVLILQNISVTLTLPALVMFGHD